MANKKELADKRDELEKELEGIDEEIETLDLQIKHSKLKDEKTQLEEERSKHEDIQAEIRSELTDVKTELEQGRLFDRGRCIENIMRLLAIKDKKLGNIERLSGNSPGYLSRMRSGKSNADPSIEFLLMAARELEVSLDMLVSSEIYEMSPTEQYLFKFIRGLIEDTEADDVFWERERLSELKRMTVGYDGYDEVYVEHPIYHARAVRKANSQSYEPEYYSEFFKDCGVEPRGDCYHAKLPYSESYLYIMFCGKGDDSIAWKKDTFYELYVVEEQGMTQPLCNTMEIAESLSVVIESLVKEIALSISHVHINEGVKKIIDGYMDARKLPFD